MQANERTSLEQFRQEANETVFSSPQLERRFVLYPYQYVGLLIVFGLTILALLGMFDLQVRQVEATGQNIRLTVEYPQRLMFRNFSEMKLIVYNTGVQPLNDLHVQIQASYLDRFSDVNIQPGADAVEDGFYSAPIPTIEPGGNQAVLIQMMGERYGTIDGVIRVMQSDPAGDTELAKVMISTFGLP